MWGSGLGADFPRGFCDKSISSSLYITLAHCSTVHKFCIEALGTQTKSRNDRLSPEVPHESRPKWRLPGDFVTLMLAQFVLKIAHLAISMKPPGSRALHVMCQSNMRGISSFSLKETML